MKTKCLIVGSLVVLTCLPTVSAAKSVTVRIGAQGLQSGTSERGGYYVVTLPVPEELSGKRLDAVLLTFYVDVAPDASIEMDYSPSVEVFPLTMALQSGRTPVFSRDHPTSRPVALGEERLVTVEITDIVRGWITAPSTNHGLVIGSFGGPKVGGLDVRSDVLGNGTAIQVTFFYQGRFGQRLSQD